MLQKSNLDDLKQAIPIKDLARRLGLEIRGNQARCYNSQAHAHNDKNFSLGFDIRRNRYKCFACGESGSVLDLLMRVKGLDIKQAIKELETISGRDYTSHKTNYAEQYSHNPPEATRKALNSDTGAYSYIYEELYSYCIGLDQESEQYLKNRGLTEETISRFLLFSIKDYQATDRHLKSKFSIDQLQEAGILGEKDNLLFYKHKIIIPFLREGRIIFLQGRRLDQENPKYLHLKKPAPLYNLDTLDEAEKGQEVYISEGVFDTMILEQNRYKAVGILGVNNFKPDYTALFKGLDVVIVLDNDKAGEQGTLKLAEMFYYKGQGVSKKQLPEGIKDITEYFKNNE